MADNLLAPPPASPPDAPPLAAAAALSPEERSQLLQRLGVPARPEDYCIACDHGLFTADGGINQQLHAAGFTQNQAQLLYDLAAERFLPLIQEMAAGFEAERQLQQLTGYFGGEERWREAARQMLAWGRRNLPAPALEALSTTAEGVQALYQMMKGSEPATLRTPAAPPGGGGEAELFALMRDPRYWRDRNAELVAQVTDGFRRLYPDGR